MNNLFLIPCLIGLIAVFFRIPALAEETAPVNDSAFHEKLLEIAGKYETFGRVDDLARFAPWLCRNPPPSVARVSESKDTSTHGQKLYFLFAKDRNGYLKLDPETAVGQCIVKESWVPKEVSLDQATAPVTKKIELTDDEKKTLQSGGAFDQYIPYAKKDGKVYHAETKAGLFIMYKLDAKTLNTDDGWVYGTVSADGKTVTSAGRVQSCMNCHKDAPHGRLFGLKNEKSSDAASQAKLLGAWSGNWVDTWKYNGQGGELTCTLSAGEGTDLSAEFKAPGFMKEPTTVILKVKSEGDGYSTSGSVDMGKPAGVLTFKAQLSGEKFTGEYDSTEERGKFEMTKK